MACRSFLLNLHEQGIPIAIVGDVLHILCVPTGFTLHLELLTRTTPKVSLTRLHGFLQCGFIHPGHHQDPAISRILHDSGDEAIAVEFKVFDKFHDSKIVIQKGTNALPHLMNRFSPTQVKQQWHQLDNLWE